MAQFDTSIFQQIRPKSVADYDNEYAQQQNNKLMLALQQQQLADAPLHSDLLRLQLQGAQLTNQKQNQLMDLLRPIVGRFAGGDTTATAAPAATSTPGSPASASPAPSIQAMADHVQALADVNTPQDALKWAQDGKDKGIFTPAQFNAGFANLQRAAQDPTAFAQWKQQAMQGGAAQLAQAQAKTSIAPATAATPPQGQGMPGNFPLSFNDVVALKLAGGPDLTPEFKTALEGVSRAPGAEVTDVRGNRRMVPKLAEGQQLNPDGTISNIPGAVEAAAAAAGATAGATTAAQEKARAPYTLVDTYRNGQPGKVPLSTVLAPTAPAAATAQVSRASNVIPPAVQAARDTDRLSILGSELQSAKSRLAQGDPRAQADIDALNREMMATPGFNPTGPSEAEKARAAANAKFATDQAGNAAAYQESLNTRVTNGQDLMLRVEEARKALDQFKPGMGAEARLNVARAAQAMGLPDSIVQRINQGDVAAKQEFMKLSAQTAMEALKQAMGTAGRITQAEFKVFQANNPNIELDKNAINKIYDFATKVYMRDRTEQAESQKFIQSGGDPAQWPATWARRMDPNGNGVISTPGVPASPGITSKPVVNAQGWTLHRDAKGNMAFVSPDGKQFQEVK